MKRDHDTSIISVWEKNCIGVSLKSFPELELVPYIFDELESTHFRFPHIATKFPRQK